MRRFAAGTASVAVVLGLSLVGSVGGAQVAVAVDPPPDTVPLMPGVTTHGYPDAAAEFGTSAIP